MRNNESLTFQIVTFTEMQEAREREVKDLEDLFNSEENEGIVESQKNKNNETDLILSESRKRFNEKDHRVTELEVEQDKMVACIVELEQKCGAEKCKVAR